MTQSHSIHVWYIFLLIYHKNQPNEVNVPYMDCKGMFIKENIRTFQDLLQYVQLLRFGPSLFYVFQRYPKWNFNSP